jgi:hypothetical protein
VGAKQKLAQVRIRFLLHLVIIIIVFWFFLFPPAVTSGVLWTQVTMQMMLTRNLFSRLYLGGTFKVCLKFGKPVRYVDSNFATDWIREGPLT